jgi:hypothetical protein
MKFDEKDKAQYSLVCESIKNQFEIEPTLESILFLIGIQELGIGLQDYDRDEKMDLIHLGTLKVLSLFGFYKETIRERNNWPIYQQNETMEIPSGEDQENFIKKGIIQYFEKQKIINT